MDLSVLQTKRDAVNAKIEKRLATIRKQKDRLIKKTEQLEKTGASMDMDAFQIRDTFGQDALSLHWDIRCLRNDLKSSSQKLKELYDTLRKYETEIQKEISQMEYYDQNCPQVIRDYLDRWEKMAYEWHVKRYEDYLVMKADLKEEEKQLYEKTLKELSEEDYEKYLKWNDRYFVSRDVKKEIDKVLKENRLDYYTLKERLKDFAGGVVLKMEEYRNEEDRLDYLRKLLAKDKKMKMREFIRMVEQVTGKLTDCSFLKIDVYGQLNGIAIGEKGRASVTTFGAGGWNVQCFHFRTKVTKLKEEK